MVIQVMMECLVCLVYREKKETVEKRVLLATLGNLDYLVNTLHFHIVDLIL